VTGRPRTTGADLDRWLTAAETILEVADRETRQVARRTSGLFLLAATVLTVAVAVAVRLPAPLDVTVVVIALLGTLAVVSRVLLWWSERRNDIRLRRRSTLSTVDDVREVLPIVARREQWDAARYDSVRARLARFPIAVK
jgi:predicted signal transduction protein with EAL and GGDEF domain